MNNPAWSVIIPTYNRPRQLAVCLAALTRLQPPARGFEVIVVNDGGSNFDARAQEFVKHPGTATRVRLLSNAHAGPGAARNHGAAEAVGDWLAFTDDDCEPRPEWLCAFERLLAAQPNALAGGMVLNAATDNVLSETSQLLVGFLAKWFDGRGRERMFTTNNIALARSAFLEAGGFDVTFGDAAAGEDREFCDRWSALGLPSRDVPDAIVHHSHELTLRTFLAQHFAYGRAGSRFRQVRDTSSRPVRIDPGFYLASLRHAGRARPAMRGAALATWTAVAHAAYVAGLARETMRGTGSRQP